MTKRDLERLAAKVEKLDFEGAPAQDILAIFSRLGLTERASARVLCVSQPTFHNWKPTAAKSHPMPGVARKLSRYVLGDLLEAALAPDGTE